MHNCLGANVHGQHTKTHRSQVHKRVKHVADNKDPLLAQCTLVQLAEARREAEALKGAAARERAAAEAEAARARDAARAAELAALQKDMHLARRVSAVSDVHSCVPCINGARHSWSWSGDARLFARGRCSVMIAAHCCCP
jgi:hypothetical protein